MLHKIQQLDNPISALPDVIKNRSTEVKAYFDKSPIQLMEGLNRLVDDLSSTDAGNCGAAAIGSALIDGVAGDTVHAQLEDMKTQINGASMGQLPDGSVTAEKLAPGAALENLGTGTVTAGKLASGAALENIGEGTISEEKLEELVRRILYHPGDLRWTGTHYPGTGWIPCDGAVYPKTLYPNLYAAIGTEYNTASTPATHFAVPDLRGRVPVVYDARSSIFGTSGNKGGEVNHTLTAAEIPSHSHGVSLGVSPGSGSVSGVGYNTGGGTASNFSSTFRAESEKVGGGQSHNNMPPYMVVYCYIKY